MFLLLRRYNFCLIQHQVNSMNPNTPRVTLNCVQKVITFWLMLAQSNVVKLNAKFYCKLRLGCFGCYWGFLHFLEVLTRFQPRNVRARRKMISVLKRGRILSHSCFLVQVRMSDVIRRCILLPKMLTGQRWHEGISGNHNKTPGGVARADIMCFHLGLYKNQTSALD